MWIGIGSIVVIGIIVAIYFMMASKSAGPSSGKAKSGDQQDSEFVQRLSYLMKIVIEHSSSSRRESSTREVIRIGESIHESGGFRYMVKIHEAVTGATSPKVGTKLKALWKGIGDWRA